MRISDWSSDVCSSDLRPCRSGAPSRAPVGQRVGIAVLVAADVVDLGIEPLGVVIPDQNAHRADLRDDVMNAAAYALHACDRLDLHKIFRLLVAQLDRNSTFRERVY